MSGDGLRDEIAAALVELPPTAIYSDGTIKIVAEPIADALLSIVQARVDAAREQVAEQIAQAIEAQVKGPFITEYDDDAFGHGQQIGYDKAARIARQHAKGDGDE